MQLLRLIKWHLIRNFQSLSQVRNPNTTLNPYGTALTQPLGPGNPQRDVVVLRIESNKDAMTDWFSSTNIHRSPLYEGMAASCWFLSIFGRQLDVEE